MGEGRADAKFRPMQTTLRAWAFIDAIPCRVSRLFVEGVKRRAVVGPRPLHHESIASGRLAHW